MKETEIGIFEAKTHLSEIIQRVRAGEHFYITRRGKRVAELRPTATTRQPLVRGAAKNADYRMADDFDEPLEDMKDYM